LNPLENKIKNVKLEMALMMNLRGELNSLSVSAFLINKK
jgi:hypothetical protein